MLNKLEVAILYELTNINQEIIYKGCMKSFKHHVWVIPFIIMKLAKRIFEISLPMAEIEHFEFSATRGILGHKA